MATTIKHAQIANTKKAGTKAGKPARKRKPAVTALVFSNEAMLASRVWANRGPELWFVEMERQMENIGTRSRQNQFLFKGASNKIGSWIAGRVKERVEHNEVKAFLKSLKLGKLPPEKVATNPAFYLNVTDFITEGPLQYWGPRLVKLAEWFGPELAREVMPPVCHNVANRMMVGKRRQPAKKPR
ncbi:MAG: hypothetical protein NT067_01780 [Candidatus Diapherotrites archaeon]|nr:hypothetical protein [Candidatus Diapherotrites archaeon]